MLNQLIERSIEMNLNCYLVYDLDKVVPEKLYRYAPEIALHQAQLPLNLDVPDDTTTLFVALGDLGKGVEVLDVIPINLAELVGKQLAISSTGEDSLQLYANDALARLIEQLNSGINHNVGFAPTTSFEYNDKLCQWTALSIRHVI